MELEINNLIAVGLVVLVGILIIKVVTKFAFKIFGIAILAVAGLGYLYFYTNYFEEHKDNKIVQAIEKKINVVSLKDFEATHCGGKQMTRTDTIECECFVQPLLKDFRSRYTEQEFDELLANKSLYLKELLAALKRNKSVIVKKLERRQAIDYWNKMVKDLKKGKFLSD
jgi:hypothetical protein